MRNRELYSPACPDAHAKALVLAGPLRGLLDDRGCYFTEKLLEKQLEVFREWREAAREADHPAFDCNFYEWLDREEDSAFVLRPGQLVKWGKGYGVVSARLTRDVSWVNQWRVVSASLMEDAWPQPMRAVEIKTPDGLTHAMNALDGALGPADIPPEVFALACGRAKDCPMLKGGRDGE